jgi:hypothetical protein
VSLREASGGVDIHVADSMEGEEENKAKSSLEIEMTQTDQLHVI